MRLSLLPMLACPDCGSDLQLVSGDPAKGGVIVNGVLQCSGCRRSFVIQRGIPHLLSKHLESAQQMEMSARDRQAALYDSNVPLALFSVCEIPSTIRMLDLNPSVLLLEAGCGTGRMTSRFASVVREVVSVDFSMKSLLRNQIKLQARGRENVHLIQADICHLPLKSALFDRAVSCQVLEHIPSAELRKRAVTEITRSVKVGSAVVVSVYQYSRWSKDKEGYHEGGIPFFRFRDKELLELLRTSLHVKSVSGTLIYIFLARCTRMPS